MKNNLRGEDIKLWRPADEKKGQMSPQSSKSQLVLSIENTLTNMMFLKLFPFPVMSIDYSYAMYLTLT